MISAGIVKFDQFSHTGNPEDESNIHDECKNTITFDCESLIVTSSKNKEDLCSIFFDITPELIKELKEFIAVMEVSNNG